jgi:hypothetical protein
MGTLEGQDDENWCIMKFFNLRLFDDQSVILLGFYLNLIG